MRVKRHPQALLRLAGLVLSLPPHTAAAASQQQQVTYGHAGQGVLPIEAPRHLGGSLYSTRFADVTWDNDAWTLTTTTLRPNDHHAVATMANGYFGGSMASTGPFFQIFAETSGWPLKTERQTFSTVSGFWDRQPTTAGVNYAWLEANGWDSVISGIPHWGPLVLELGDGSYIAANTSTDQFANVRLTQDYRQGLAIWQYTWAPHGTNNTTFNITYTAFAHRLNVNRAYVQLNVTASQDTNVTLYNILDGRNALRTTFNASGSQGNLLYTGVNPNGVDNVTAWMYSGVSGTDASPQNFTGAKPFIGATASTVVQAFNLSLTANETTSLLKHVGVASTDGFADPQQQARKAVQDSLGDDFASTLASHVDEWQQAMPRDSVANYTDPTTGLLPATEPELIEKALVTVVSTFSILQNTISANALAAVGNASININGISVCGLTSDCYGGQLFWDQDVWMAPTIQAVAPVAAKQIVNARIKQYPQAQRNIAAAFDSSRNATDFSPNAAAYPWTSGRDANCTATGPCYDYEYHLNGDIVRSFLTQWAASGDTESLRVEMYPIIQSVSALFSNLLQKNGSSWELLNMTDPDEYANNVDDGGFTMPLLASVLNDSNILAQYFGDETNATWQEQAEQVYIPTSGNLSMEYNTMNGSIEVKQADVVLKIYPLVVENNYTLAQQQADLNYYAGHQSPEGPGMTFAIFSIDANTISPSGCAAYTYDEYSWSPYARAPWFAFSEQLIDDPILNGGTNPAFPFLTGHGGFLQVDLYGYLGLRRTIDWVLHVDPALPPQIPYLGFPKFYHHGWPIVAHANQTHTTLTRSGSPLATANMTFATESISVVVKAAPSTSTASNSTSTSTTTTYSLPANGTLTILNRQYFTTKTVPGDILQCQPVSSSTTNVPGLFARAAIDGAESTIWQGQNASEEQSFTVDTSTVPFQPLAYASFNWAQQPPVAAAIILHNDSDWRSGQTVNVSMIAISTPYDANATDQAAIVPYAGNTTTVHFNESVWSANYVTLVTEGNQGNGSTAAPGASVANFALVGTNE